MRKFIAVLLIFLVVALPIGTALAETTTYVPLKMKKDYKLKPSTESTDIYKLNLTSDSIVILKWMNNTEFSAGIEIYKNKECTIGVAHPWIRDKEKGSGQLTIPKGKYYIKMYDDNAKSIVSFNCMKLTTPKNISPAKATKLAANKTAYAALLPMQTKACWYKFSVSKRKNITFYFNSFNGYNFMLYDEDMRSAGGMSAGSGEYSIDRLLSRGVYYIAVISTGAASKYCGDAVSIKWK